MTTSSPEILAPAGDMTCLQAALDAGADAIYIGLDALNMRHAATSNFTRETLPDAAERCRQYHVKLYLTLNTIVYENETNLCHDILAFAKPYIDAAIVADWAALQVCQDLGIPFHISTQMSCANTKTARFLKQQGASRIVLARECTLEEVAIIAKNADIPVETFVHGAICLAVSGRCLLSHEAYGYSASRGECRQPCRRKFTIQEVPQGDNADASFRVEPNTLLSARDLCSLPFVDKLMEAGIASFKIEGRGRNPEYVKTVVSAYKTAVQAVQDNRFTPELVQALTDECAKVYHRPFSCGLYYGRPGTGQLSDTDQNQATEKKHHVGIVLNYFKEAHIAQIKIQGYQPEIGDRLSFHGEKTGVAECTVHEIHQDDTTFEKAPKGTWVTIPCEPIVRRNDKVYVVKPSA
jgi:putative protease